MREIWTDEALASYYEQIQKLLKEKYDLSEIFRNEPDEWSIDMNDETGHDPHEVAADPAEDHKTPGGQPGDNSPTEHDTATETTVETPGGTTVTETPARSGDVSKYASLRYVHVARLY